MPTLKNQYAPRHALALLIALIAAAPMARASYTFTNFSVPGASHTSIAGISGSSIFGGYTDANSVNHGFIMTNGQLTTLDAPQGWRRHQSRDGCRGDIGQYNRRNLHRCEWRQAWFYRFRWHLFHI